jgi:hypothetical protein
MPVPVPIKWNAPAEKSVGAFHLDQRVLFVCEAAGHVRALDAFVFIAEPVGLELLDLVVSKPTRLFAAFDVLIRVMPGFDEMQLDVLLRFLASYLESLNLMRRIDPDLSTRS